MWSVTHGSYQGLRFLLHPTGLSSCFILGLVFLMHGSRCHTQAWYSLKENRTVSSGICFLRSRKPCQKSPSLPPFPNLMDQKYQALKKYFALKNLPVSFVLSPSTHSLSPISLLSSIYCCLETSLNNSTIWPSFHVNKYRNILFSQRFSKRFPHLCKDF